MQSRVIFGLAFLLFSLTFVMPVFAQNANDIGTPAESKPGQSNASSYSRDKLETVNLSNGNLSLHIPLVTIGGRGSAAFSVSLAYNSKAWTPYHDQDAAYTDAFGNHIPPLDHWSAKFDDLAMREPGVYALGSGWTLLTGYSMKMSKVNIQLITTGCSVQPDCGYKYVLTRLWLLLPDGSEVELRDDLTNGAPSITPTDGNNYHPPTDRTRGRIWHSTDGSGIVYVADSEITTQDPSAPILNGWVFYPDGTRLRMTGTYGACTKIIDRNGNYITFDGSTYTDELGRQVTLSTSESNLTITVKGYNGLADRVISADLATIGALDGGGVPTNLRADFRSLQRPFYSGDYLRTRDANGAELDWDHTDSNPHTDLFSGSENPDAVDQHVALTTLHLLDERTLRFRYNQYGEVAEIVYPGGGVSDIDYSAGVSGLCEAGPAALRVGLNRRVTQRRSLADGSSVDAVTTYTFDAGSVDGVTYPRTVIETHQGSASETLLASDTHYFLARDAEYRSCAARNMGDGTGYEKWQNAKEFRTEQLTGTGTVVTKRTWAQRADVAWPNDVGYSYNWYVTFRGQEQPPNDPRVTVEDTILENGKMKRVEYDYDNFNNVTGEREYDFGNTTGSVGALKRQTIRTYGAAIGSNYGIVNNGVCYSNLNPADSSCGSGLATDVTSIVYQPHLLLNQTVKDGSGTQVAYSEFEYDNYSSSANHAAVTTNSGMIQYDGTQFSTFSSTYQPRSNVTKASRWAGGSNYISSFAQYDNAGQVIASIDGRGYTSTISHADNFGSGSNPDSGAGGTNGATFAFPTLVTNALGHQAKSQYDYTLGEVTGVKDPNGVIAKIEYDSIGRPTRTTAALGLAEQVISEVTYPTSGSNAATASKQMDATRWLASKTIFDGFDRVVTSWQAEDGQHASTASFSIRTITIYDALGRVKQVSNPYRPTIAGGTGETALYTTTVYDLAGRMTSVTTPDTATVSTSYNGNEVTVTDQTGKQRKSVTDGLGRLAQVYEDPAGLNYLTSYSYDTLDNLTSVTQGSQTPRTFVYDPLKRLLSATNPESGTVCYGTVVSGVCQPDGYDANGNLIYKTDARLIRTTYAYDALNRATTRSYSDGTPPVTYAYDPAIMNGKGRLSSVSSSVVSYSFGNYDALGRVKSATQTIYGTTNQTYTMGYSYDLTGQVTGMTYPSGHTVNYSFDNGGRLSDFTGYLGDSTLRNYSTGIAYAATGQMTQEQFGTTTPIYNKLFYNSRGQLSEIREGITPNDTNWERGAIINHYSDSCWGMCGGSDSTTSMTDNNGNLKKQDVYIPGGALFTQFYSYDSLNRLQSVTEDNPNGQANWKQSYVYDRYGNRTVDQNSANTYGSGIPKPNFGVDAVTNRLTVPSGYGGAMTYDAAGNLVTDTYSAGGVLRLYDAENRMTQETQETQANSYVAGVYSYDGDGRRVKRNVGGVETWQVYGVGGELIAEYAANMSATSPQKEYGYRNGQLLITVTATSGTAGTAFTFTDDPLVAGTTMVKAIHLTELRTAVDQARAHAGLSAASWAETITAGSTTIKASHITELRAKLDEARSALGLATATYTDSSLGIGDPIRAVDFQELRTKTNETLTTVTGAGVDVRWLVSDQLGTPRMILDQSGSLSGVSRHDYLPFGEELFAGTGGRTTAQGYSASDGVRQKFTQKERDNETGLDYFEARYYSSTQGRFTSVDPINLTRERLIDPQQINLYQYTRNDPLNLLDPTGETIDFEKDKNGSLTKNGTYSQEEYEKYKDLLNKDPKKYASELATLNRLEGSKINYIIGVTTKDVAGGGEAEGLTSTDGTNVLVTIRNRGNGQEKFTIEGRFAHELEHARQFDNGEFHFVRTASGVWAPDPKTYDIYDEVRAFKAQLDVTAPVKDTSMLRMLRDDRLTDADRASVLRSSYPKRNQTDTNVTYLWGAPPGALVRPNAQHPNVFGVVH